MRAGEGSHTVIHYNTRFPTFAVSERELADADVHAARALLRLQFQDRRELARADATAALALDATHVLAHQVLYTIDEAITLDSARAVAQAHPDDRRA